MSSEPYLGAIKTFAFSFPPRGYALANGQLLSVSQYTALYALIGTYYGGNGQTNFALPNLQGRTQVGQGQLAGGSNYTIGQAAGTENVTMTQAQMPQHTHLWSNSGSALNAVQVKGTEQAPDTGAQLARLNDPGGNNPVIYVPANTSGAQVALGGLNVAGTNSIAGGSQPLPILQPYLTLNFSVAITGLFPSRN